MSDHKETHSTNSEKVAGMEIRPVGEPESKRTAERVNPRDPLYIHSTGSVEDASHFPSLYEYIKERRSQKSK